MEERETEKTAACNDGMQEDISGEDEITLIDEPAEEQPVDEPAAEKEADAALQDLKEKYMNLNNHYMRLHADFDNYKKRVNRDKEELVKYGNESLLHELLPAIDNLELALKHADQEQNSGLVTGVEMTFKELHRILEKFGLTRIPAEGLPFDPAVHHAMMQVERGDMEEKMVAEELRTGYRYRDKVLRPSLVSVSVKPQATAEASPDDEKEVEE